MSTLRKEVITITTQDTNEVESGVFVDVAGSEKEVFASVEQLNSQRALSFGITDSNTALKITFLVNDLPTFGKACYFNYSGGVYVINSFKKLGTNPDYFEVIATLK